MPKQPKVYGTPVGTETPSTATDRKVAKPATDAQVHAAVKASDTYRTGREAPPRASSLKAAGPSSGISDADKGVVDQLKNRGKRIDSAVEAAEKGG